MSTQTHTIEGRYVTIDVMAHAGIDEIKARITDEVTNLAEEAGMTLVSIAISPPERDRSVFDPLDQCWVVPWKAVLE